MVVERMIGEIKVNDNGDDDWRNGGEWWWLLFLCVRMVGDKEEGYHVCKPFICHDGNAIW